MLILFTALDQHKYTKSLSFRTTSLEAGLNFLTLINTHGGGILTAKLIDNDGITNLAVDAFDGECFVVPMHQLEQQWQTVLREPLRTPSVVDQERIETTQQQVHTYERRMASLLLTIQRFDVLLKRTETSLLCDLTRTQLIRHYQAYIKRYEQHLAKSLVYYKQLTQRLRLLSDIATI